MVDFGFVLAGGNHIIGRQPQLVCHLGDGEHVGVLGDLNIAEHTDLFLSYLLTCYIPEIYRRYIDCNKLWNKIQGKGIFGSAKLRVLFYGLPCYNKC